MSFVQNISKQLNDIIIFHINNQINERNEAIENYDMMFDNGNQVKNLLTIFDQIAEELEIPDVPQRRMVLIRLFKSGLNNTKEQYLGVARSVLNNLNEAGPSSPPPTKKRPITEPTAPRKKIRSEMDRRRIVESLQKIDEDYINRAPYVHVKVASKEEKESKRKALKYYNKEDHCTVCLEELENDVCMIFECEHLFHCKCLINPYTREYWHSCPICREPYVPGNLIRNVNVNNNFGNNLKKILKYLQTL
jgi:hypothetical protein